VSSLVLYVAHGASLAQQVVRVNPYVTGYHGLVKLLTVFGVLNGNVDQAGDYHGPSTTTGLVLVYFLLDYD
jgi:hypothetical protein